MSIVYVSSDGDNIGAQVGKAGLADDAESMRRISNAIKQGNQILVSWVIEQGGDVILDGGDETSFSIDAEKLAQLPDIREKWYKAVGATLSMGVGKRLSQAGMALMASKLKGKDQITLWTPEVEREVQQTMAEPKMSAEDKIRDEYFKAEDVKGWLKNEPKALAMVIEGLNQAKRGEFGKDPRKDDEKDLGKKELKLLDHLMDSQEPSLKDKMDSATQGEGNVDEAAQAEGLDSGQVPGNQAMEPGQDPNQEGQGPPEQIGVDEAGEQDAKEVLRGMMGEALVAMKENAGEVEALKESNPELYQAIEGLVAATANVAQSILGPEEGEDGEVEEGLGKSQDLNKVVLYGDGIDKAHGWISPEGKYYQLDRDDGHAEGLQTITSDTKIKDAKNDLQAAIAAHEDGWISIGHGGEANIQGHSKILNNPNHPATRIARALAGKYHFDKTLLVHSDKAGDYNALPGPKSNGVQMVNTKLWSKHGGTKSKVAMFRNEEE